MISFIVNVIIYFPILLISFYGYGFLYQRFPKKKPSDFSLVLGCGLSGKVVSPILAQRLEKAIEYYNHTGKNSVFVVSGGQGKDELVAEALAMKNFLCTHGIPEEKILMEDQSRTTRENMIKKYPLSGLVKRYGNG